MSLFESYERRIDQITPVLEKYGIKDLDEAKQICLDKGFDPYEIVKGVQPICFENACWAYTLGAAIAIKQGCVKASEAAKDIGEGLFISSRAVSGAIRKLVTDGYVEKIGQDPVVYALTEKGKTVEII